MASTTLDDNLIREEAERCSQLSEGALRKALLNAIGKRNMAAGAVLGQRLGHTIGQSYTRSMETDPQSIIDEHEPEILIGRLQAAGLRGVEGLIEDLQDLTSQREIIESDRFVLAQARETLAHLESRDYPRQEGGHLLRPATMDSCENLLRPAESRHVPEDQMLRAVDRTV